jgi:hypothetical protein
MPPYFFYFNQILIRIIILSILLVKTDENSIFQSQSQAIAQSNAIFSAQYLIIYLSEMV